MTFDKIVELLKLITAIIEIVIAVLSYLKNRKE